MEEHNRTMSYSGVERELPPVPGSFPLESPPPPPPPHDPLPASSSSAPTFQHTDPADPIDPTSSRLPPHPKNLDVFGLESRRNTIGLDGDTASLGSFSRDGSEDGYGTMTGRVGEVDSRRNRRSSRERGEEVSRGLDVSILKRRGKSS